MAKTELSDDNYAFGRTSNLPRPLARSSGDGCTPLPFTEIILSSGITATIDTEDILLLKNHKGWYAT